MRRDDGVPSAGQQGFTLIELMIATAILGIVLAGLVTLLNSGQRAYSRGSNTIDAQQNARVALDRMAKEIREAGYHPRPPETAPSACPPGPGNLYPSGGGTENPCWSFYPIVNPAATSFTVQFDWNGSGTISTSGRVNDPLLCATGTACRGERVTYSLSGQNLQRQEVGDPNGAQTVATGIDSLAFTYLKSDGGTTTNPELIRSVQMRITVKAGSDGSSATMLDTVRIRGR
jgi:prepilin-type N-terminal cleavage/methylation domain-containing protein